jgi:hypothetical protein
MFQRHILPLFPRGQRLIIDPLRITTLVIITTQEVGTIPIQTMDMEEYIIMLLVDLVVLTTKVITLIIVIIQQLSALFMEELNMFTQEETMVMDFMWATEPYQFNQDTYMQTGTT